MNWVGWVKVRNRCGRSDLIPSTRALISGAQLGRAVVIEFNLRVQSRRDVSEAGKLGAAL